MGITPTLKSYRAEITKIGQGSGFRDFIKIDQMATKSILLVLSSFVVITPACGQSTGDPDMLAAEEIYKQIAPPIAQSSKQTDDQLADEILNQLPPPDASFYKKNSTSVSPASPASIKPRSNKLEVAGKVGRVILRSVAGGLTGYSDALARNRYQSPIVIIQPTTAPAYQASPMPQMHSFSSTRIGDTVYTHQYY